MSQNNRCNRRNASGTIRDRVQSENQACVLTEQVFDGVQEALDAAPCTVSIPDPPGTVTELLAAATAQTAAQCENITLEATEDGLQEVACTLVSPGTCVFRLSNNSIRNGSCLIRQDFNARLCFPEDALLPCGLTALCSAQILRSAPAETARAEEAVFTCLCDGARAVFVTATVPLYVGSAGRFAPADASVRRAACSPETPPFFPQTEGCDAVLPSSACMQNRQ